MGFDLASLLGTVAGRRAVVVGDTILDVYVQGVTRGLCREAPAPAVSVQSVDAVPGGAANTAVNLAALGGHASLISVVGEDAAGLQVTDLLRARGVSTEGLLRVAGRGTLVKRRVVVGSRILVRLDEGTTSAVPSEVESALCHQLGEALRRAEALVVSDGGYATMSPTVRAALERDRESLPVVVVDARDALAYQALRPTVVTPNYAEAARLLRVPALDEEADRVRQIREVGAGLLELTRAESVVVTLGAGGAILFERGRPPFHSRVRDRAVDQETVGAGDVFAATVALALSASADPSAAAELATLVASTAAAATIGTAVCSLDHTRRRLTAGDKILAPGDVSAWADAARARGQRIVFTNGCFDLVHEGHVTFLNEAKALGDVLIVGVNDDDSVRSLKGPGRPVVDLPGRLRLLAALSCVDQVVPFSGRSPATLIETVRPDIFAKGGDYAGANLTEGDLLRSLGTDIRILSYVEDRSTSQIIQRVRGSA